jgi:hypothetical protein
MNNSVKLVVHMYVGPACMQYVCASLELVEQVASDSVLELRM